MGDYEYYEEPDKDPGTQVILIDEITDKEQQILMGLVERRSQLESFEFAQDTGPTSVHELQDTEDETLKAAMKALTHDKF